MAPDDETWDPQGKSVLAQLLHRAKLLNDKAGVLLWDPERLAEDPIADPGLEYPRLRPPTATEPRLFISYSWGRDEQHMDDYSSDMWVDAFAGSLFNRRYQIVFDRDPRNLDLELPAHVLLARMNDCNYFVPIITEGYAAAVTGSGGAQPGLAGVEWNHARKGLDAGFFRFVGVWVSGGVLPEPLTPETVVDVRESMAPWGAEIDELFPDPQPGGLGCPTVPPPDRPPDPEGWPAFIPYGPDEVTSG